MRCEFVCVTTGVILHQLATLPSYSDTANVMQPDHHWSWRGRLVAEEVRTCSGQALSDFELTRNWV